MKEFLIDAEHILIDGTNIVSNSKNIDLASCGYNSSGNHDPQVNLLFMFSSKLNKPAYFRVLPGNVRDVKAFKLTLEESGIKDVTVVADKGFYSKKNIVQLENIKLKYIIPLRRNSSLLSYKKIQTPSKNGFEDYFSFNGRFVWYYIIKNKNKNCIVYYDPKIASKEEHDYLSRIETHPEEYSLDKFRIRSSGFGTFSLYTNIQTKTAQELYEIYKSRNDIEVMFDALKNVLKSDTTYMQNTESMQGWFFISYIAISLYYRLYVLLKEKDMLKKYSVADILMHLKLIKKVNINNQWKIAEIPSKTENILTKADIHIT